MEQQQDEPEQQASNHLQTNPISASSVSQRSNRSRKGAKIKSLGTRNRDSLTSQVSMQQRNASRSKFASQNREASLNEQNKGVKTGGPQSAAHQKSEPAISESSNKRQSRVSQHGHQDDQKVLVPVRNLTTSSSAAKEESKQPRIPAVLNGKVVTKKKKTRTGNNIPSSSPGAVDYIPLQSQSTIDKKGGKSKKFKQTISDLSTSKLNSASASANQATKSANNRSEKSRVASSIEIQNQAKYDLQMKTVSNWDQSRQSREVSEGQQKMMATTGALSPQSAGKIKIDADQKQPQKIDPNAVVIDSVEMNEEGGQQRGDDQHHHPAANLPASPASKAPMHVRVSELRPTPLDLSHPSIVIERDDESPSSPPVSAGPIIREKRDAQAAESANTFGIRLQKVPEPRDGDEASKEQRAASNLDFEQKTKSALDTTPQSLTITAANNASAALEEQLGPDGQKAQLTEPLPILAKVSTVIHMPIKCPIENVRFIQLKRFLAIQKERAAMMSLGFDLVGQRRKMIQMKTEDKIQKGKNSIEDQEKLAKIDDTTHYIKSIIYAREPKIIDQEKQHVNQRDAFQHLNNLDVKILVEKSKYLGEESKYASLSPRTVQRHRVNQTRGPILDCQVYKLKDAEDKTLLFESRFESGNLYLAQKVSDQEYNLLMSNDINTQGHTQWFFFQVRNTRAGNKVRFNILNYSKPDALFNYGMKISVYSDKKSEKKGTGWHKDGEDIRYFINGIRKDVTYYSKCYYTATFTYTFEHDDDTVYFAYSIPYTYSDLRNDITAIEQDTQRSKLMRKATLCRTLSGELCEVLTITSADNLENFRHRKGIVLTARVHPGETVGSWMMRGCLTFLTDPDNKEAKLLRENFVFKVVPMLNPDGVINGNYRCSLAGCDLNRRWKTPNKTLHPTIFHTKRLVKQIHQERGLVLFCDLHGHSRKQNVFMYGCNNKQNPGECRIFPFILGKMNKYFCYDYSRFGVQKSKEATARVALYKELKNVPNIFTMESSFAGVDFGPAAGQHLTTDMLETLGHDCCRAILIYCNIYVPPELQDQPFFKNIMLSLQAKQKNASSLNKKNFKEPVFDMQSAICSAINGSAELLNNTGGDDSSSGSDSAPSEDNLQAEELIKQLPTADKTLKLQLKKNEQKRKKEEEEEIKKEQSTVKLRRQSSGRNLKKEEPKRQQSPLKRQIPAPEKKEEPKKEEEKKKPKVETRDAQTQTDRSDYQLIKQKMMRERRLKEEQAAAAQKKQTQPIGSNQSDLRMRIVAQTAQDYIPKQQSMRLNTSQRLQQMVGAGVSEFKTQAGTQNMHIQQAHHAHHQPGKPLKHLQQQGVPQPTTQVRNPVGHNQTAKTQRIEASGAKQQAQIPGSGNQKLNIPEKKYNFMGVSTIKQGQQQPSGHSSQPQTASNDINNEYGPSGGATIPRPAVGAPSPMKQEQLHEGNLYHSQGIHREKIKESIQKSEIVGSLKKVDSRRSGNRVVSGAIGELPAMTTLSGNTNNSFLEQHHSQQQYSGAASRIHHKHSGSYQLGQSGPRNQTFETDPNFSVHRQQPPGIFSPHAVAANSNISGLKAQFILPQTKQLPQKEFVMMEVGQASKSGGGATAANRKTSHNNPKNSNNSSINGVTGQNNYGQSKLGQVQQKFHKSTVGSKQQQFQQPDAENANNQMSRFNQQRNVANINNAPDSTLARNNSTHGAVLGKYNVPLGSSPMTKVTNNHIHTQKSGISIAPDTAHLADMTHSQPAVTRNSSSINQVNGSSHIGPSVTGQSSLRASYNAQRTPQQKSGTWQNNTSGSHNPHQMLMMESSNIAATGHQYRAMGTALPHQSQTVTNDHDQSNKLPALNLRGPGAGKSTLGRQGAVGQNTSGMIGGLKIVLNNGQAMTTPQQKIPFQIGPGKFSNQSQIVSPQVQHNINGAGGGSGAQGGPSCGLDYSEQPMNHHSNATSSAKLKHNAHHNATHFSAAGRFDGGKQHASEHKMHAAMPNLNGRSGSGTPSGNQAHLRTSPRRHGSFSYEADQLHDFEVSEGLLRAQRDPHLFTSGHNHQATVGGVSRLRNHSEVAELRHTKKSNYGRGVLGPKNAETVIGFSPHTVNMNLTPNVNGYGKKNIFATATMPAPHSNVVGKRYSRH